MLVVPGSGSPARVEPLTVVPAAALRLGGLPAPLNELRLQQILIGSRADGVLPVLSRRDAASDRDARLAALWEVLVPEPERRDLLAGKYRKLVIVPDAALALLPFEALVVAEGREQKYLLDAGPPIIYAPSATLYKPGRSPGHGPGREPRASAGRGRPSIWRGRRHGPDTHQNPGHLDLAITLQRRRGPFAAACLIRAPRCGGSSGITMTPGSRPPA